MQYLGHETLEILNLRNTNTVGNENDEVLQQDMLLNTLTGKQAEQKPQGSGPCNMLAVSTCASDTPSNAAYNSEQANTHSCGMTTLSKQILTVVG